jgi:hypothetical protein
MIPDQLLECRPMFTPRVSSLLFLMLASVAPAFAQTGEDGRTEADIQNYICATLTTGLAEANRFGASGYGDAYESMAAGVDCAHKRYAFTLKVTAAVKDRAPNILEDTANILVRSICAKPGWDRVFELGWTVSAEFTFDGRAIAPAIIVSRCPASRH